MYEAKTKETKASVIDFIEAIENDEKKADAYRLLDIFEKESGFPAKMWGPSIIGFGKYHYKYASGHEGQAPLVGFSPRKANISLYLLYEGPERDALLENFGKYKGSKACIYVKRLTDVDESLIREMIKLTMKRTLEQYPDEVD